VGRKKGGEGNFKTSPEEDSTSQLERKGMEWGGLSLERWLKTEKLTISSGEQVLRRSRA